jgi:hypothetical protein
MSTISAKSFAQSARTIAYLEGECGRLKTMLDHFRLVNDKMMCDIRIAREEGMNQKCLEHRLKLTVENEGVLQGRDCMEICLCILLFFFTVISSMVFSLSVIPFQLCIHPWDIYPFLILVISQHHLPLHLYRASAHH